MNIREKTQEVEALTCCEHATLSQNSRGRIQPESECQLRTVFQRDRDRIIHCKSFRRLKHKTQVFLAPEGDHYRTRLTHTLEVSQIARTIARALRLNEDLTEAIALGHDLGHTPFGHAGERALNSVHAGGFQHYLQSVRVVERLEKSGRGLNLTYEVKNGIACHTSGAQADTPEGRVVRLSDKIAYINHDIADAVRAGVLDVNDIPPHITDILGQSKSQRIDHLVRSVIACGLPDVNLDHQTAAAFTELTTFMFDRVYTNKQAKGEEGKAEDLLKKLYAYFVKHPEQLPQEYSFIVECESKEQAALDYVAGMTDGYALQVFERLFIPRSWAQNVMD